MKPRDYQRLERERGYADLDPRDPERTLAALRGWASDPNPHVRKGTRLRLPWAMRVAWLDTHPERVIELLGKDDPTRSCVAASRTAERSEQGAPRPRAAHVRRVARP